MLGRCVVVALMLLPGAAHAAERWLEVLSPHFRVITNGTEAQARRTALAFEQMRAVFSRNNSLRLDSAAEMTIFAPRDEGSMKKLIPEAWKQRGGSRPAGLFSEGWERDYALVGLDYPGSTPYEIVYHEYAHKMLRTNLRRVPLWLNEGIAEFYSNSRFSDTEARVGAPSPRLPYLQARTLIPLKGFLTATAGSDHYTKEDKAARYYAQCWALTHYLVFGKGMDNGKKLNAYVRKLQTGADVVQSFEESFGALAAVQKEFDQYIRQFMMYNYVLKNPAALSEKDLRAVPLEGAALDAALGAFHLHFRHEDLARRHFEAALRADPDSAAGHEGIGFVLFDEGKDGEALAHFKQAASRDPKRHLSVYYAGMLEHAGRKESQPQLKAALLKTLETNPNFAPAMIELSRLAAAEHDLQSARFYTLRASELEVSRAGYLSHMARIHEFFGNLPNAATVSQLVIDRWTGPDRYEAMEILRRARPEALAAVLSPDDELKTNSLQGRIKRSTCDKDGITIELETTSGLETVKTDGPYMGGFSDTLWYGRDHFSYCHHLEGSEAVLRFRDDKGKKVLYSYEIRDTLLPPSVISTMATTGN